MRCAVGGHGARAQLVVCSAKRPARDAFSSAPIEIPPLQRRTTELARIIEEYATDAMTELKAPRGTFRGADRDWIIEQTLSEIEKATARLVALRANGYNVTRAATKLGMAHVSLARWIGRRRLPPQ